MWTKWGLTRINFCGSIKMRKNIGSGLEQTVPFLYAFFPDVLSPFTHRDYLLRPFESWMRRSSCSVGRPLAAFVNSVSLVGFVESTSKNSIGESLK